MDNHINLFLRSFKNELTETEIKELAKLLEDSDLAKKYENYKRIWKHAIAKGETINPDSERAWVYLSAKIDDSEKRKRRFKRSVVLAATISGIAAALVLFFIFNTSVPTQINKDMLADAASAEWAVSASDKIIIRTASDHYYSIASKQAEIAVMDDGRISINSVQLDNVSAHGLNRVRIPRGKMANLSLPDGTRICLNSNSDITFPSEFTSPNRMVYLSGEAYFSVARDEQRPFSVLSDMMEVSVLGTEFNFAASGISAVVTLVSGKVQVETDMAQTCVLSPNQQVTFENGRLDDVKDVDVESIICWTTHKIICKDQNISDVFEKLAQYFDTDFIFNEPLDDIFISGKLDLTDNLDSVLESIEFVAPVHFTESNKGIIVSRNID
ncbi:MAG: FecR family protein [Candidatus Cryptobacteroides sp.]